VESRACLQNRIWVAVELRQEMAALRQKIDDLFGD
jgi:hypothetical protein